MRSINASILGRFLTLSKTSLNCLFLKLKALRAGYKYEPTAYQCPIQVYNIVPDIEFDPFVQELAIAHLAQDIDGVGDLVS